MRISIFNDLKYTKWPRKYIYSGWGSRKLKGNNWLILSHHLPLDAHIFANTIVFHLFGMTTSQLNHILKAQRVVRPKTV